MDSNVNNRQASGFQRNSFLRDSIHDLAVRRMKLSKGQIQDKIERETQMKMRPNAVINEGENQLMELPQDYDREAPGI